MRKEDVEFIQNITGRITSDDGSQSTFVGNAGTSIVAGCGADAIAKMTSCAS